MAAIVSLKWAKTSAGFVDIGWEVGLAGSYAGSPNPSKELSTWAERRLGSLGS
ncbi:hypothetical protein WN944_003337 [Citrus x changshan-huyou]|uniref:Uncharacterized protein n=1 Tax=Citrus x changshan-huyou TaxID=2935761 RepID=A0AAP0QHW5_9ROSI